MSKYELLREPPQRIFRTYDIRGIVGETLTPDVVYTVGRAIGSEALAKGQTKVAVGRDGRLSGPDFLEAMVAGLLDSGCDVLNVGEVTTPMLYFSASVLDTRSGIMITGSHNPPEFNGIKIVIDGTTLCEDAIQALRRRVVNDDLATGKGTEEKIDIRQRYVDDILARITLERPLKVVIDCGNGVGGIVAPEIFKRLGCEVIELFCEVDGTFPNHHPDPLIAKNLQDVIKAVKEHNADVGLAFDGDADRLGLVTSTGDIVWPDRQMILFVRDILPRHSGAHIPYDVKCTRHLTNEIKAAGGVPEMIRTGHALLKAKVWELNAPIGGELSGHFFFKENWYGFDDGIYAGVRMLEILSKDSRPSSEVFATVPNSMNTPELKMNMAEEKKAAFMDKVREKAVPAFADAKVNTIDGVRVDFENGFGLVRQSNTTPTIIIRFEGDSKEALNNIQERFRKLLLEIDSNLELPF